MRSAARSRCLLKEILEMKSDVWYTSLIMKRRTQLYLDDEMARALAALSRQRGVSVSELVRESVEEAYMSKKKVDKAALARQLSGVWQHRKDLKDIDRYIRSLRRGKRLKRLGIG
jgi:hypothetical protein